MMENNTSHDKALLPAKPIKRISKKKIILLCGLTLIISLIIWDCAEPPLWWQFEAQRNQKVILDYAKEHYPNAKIVQEVYQSTGLNFTSNPHDYIVFEQNGVTFSIWANDGVFSGENYLDSKAIQYIENEIIRPFWEDKDLTANYSIYLPGEAPTGNIAEYTDCIFITIFIECTGDIQPPETFDWFYDFYLYLINDSNIQNYDIDINYGTRRKLYYSINFTENTNFEDRDAFYSFFETAE